eukprot:3847801-Rhodomonas_salina.1
MCIRDRYKGYTGTVRYGATHAVGGVRSGGLRMESLCAVRTPIVLCRCYEVPGTDIAYLATNPGQRARVLGGVAVSALEHRVLPAWVMRGTGIAYGAMRCAWVAYCWVTGLAYADTRHYHAYADTRY